MTTPEPSSRSITDEAVFKARRKFLMALGLGAPASVGLGIAGQKLWQRQMHLPPLPREALQAQASGSYRLDAEQTAEADFLNYNNFYEFSLDKRGVAPAARNFSLDPYSLQIDGLVDRPGSIPLETLEALGLEERVYRFRCVEAWSMVVPWIGLPLHKLLNYVGLKNDARYIAFESFLDPEQAPGQRNKSYAWPYYEALAINEALHPLALVATGAYGQRLAPQSGAPLRMVVPWKYGYKSAKSIVHMRVTAERPNTFWNDLQPAEYSWTSNVDPHTPHPRWSQSSERILGSGERIPTLPYNGYAESVGSLYKRS